MQIFGVRGRHGIRTVSDQTGQWVIDMYERIGQGGAMRQLLSEAGLMSSKSDHVRWFKTKDGEVYGFTVGGVIYYDPRIATAETLVHEYDHGWFSMLEKTAPELVEELIRSAKREKTLWEYVRKAYPGLKSDKRIADEVFAHYGGREGEKQLTRLQREAAMGKGDIFERAARISAIEKLKNAIRNMWLRLMDIFGYVKQNRTLKGVRHIDKARSIEEFRQMSMRDLARGINPFDGGDGGGAREHKSERRNNLSPEANNAPRFHRVSPAVDEEAEREGLNSAREIYEKSVTHNLGFNLMEAYVDNMRSVMKFYDAMEKASGIKTSDFENAYQAENLMHGANEREHAEYKRMYTKPMLDEVKNVLSQMDGSVKERYEVLKRYLIAKHGLERNRALSRISSSLGNSKL